MNNKDLGKIREKIKENLQKDLKTLVVYKNDVRTLELQIAEKRGSLELLNSIINSDKILLEIIKEGDKK